MALMLLAFFGMFGLIGSVGLLFFYRDTLRGRLAAVIDPRHGPKARLSHLMPAKEGAFEGIVRPFQNVLPRNPRDVSILQKRLIRAGCRQRSAVNIFYGSRVFLPLVAILLAFLTGAHRFGPAPVTLIAAGVGFAIPDVWLARRLANRKLMIHLGLPEALDLMVVCTEAGLSMDQTMQRVSRELRVSQPEISDEFGFAVLEQKAGKPREDTLRDLADRTNVASLRVFVNTLVQSDTFGTGIAKTLRVYSETLRTQRRQKAEEEAAKTTVKLVFPLVLFIFPSLFVVVLGPALISMHEGFEKYFSAIAK
jgi:tight adherence protein C